jgi:gag-polyprotein putative aspartyl protease
MVKATCGFSDGSTGTGRGLLVEYGPTLQVDIGFDPDYTTGNPLPDLAIKGVQALVDTGATASCIDSALAMRLNLPVVDRQRVRGVGGIHEVNMHLGHVAIPTLQKVIIGQFAGVNLVEGGHVALIGRTFLQHFTLIYEGRTGNVSITDEPAAVPPIFQTATGS